MTEPTGHRLDGTVWDEARPPHLPDRLTRVSPWVYPFVLAAVVQFQRAWVGELGPSSIVISLFGAALFVRHPDARRSMPLLVFGVVLLAAGELLEAASDPIARFIDGLIVPGDPELISPAVLAWSVLTALVGIFALLYTGAGLSAARRRASIGAAGLITVWLTVLAIASFSVSVLSLPGAIIDPSPFSVVTLAIGLVLSLASTLAWTYMLVVSLSGWLAGETPRLGWAFAAVAAALFLAIRMFVALFSLFTLPEGVGSIASPLIGYGSDLGWVLLLVGFAVGLPSTEQSTERPSTATPDPPEETTRDSVAG